MLAYFCTSTILSLFCHCRDVHLQTDVLALSCRGRVQLYILHRTGILAELGALGKALPPLSEVKPIILTNSSALRDHE